VITVNFFWQVFGPDSQNEADGVAGFFQQSLYNARAQQACAL
jgi:hypothetical protein